MVMGDVVISLEYAASQAAERHGLYGPDYSTHDELRVLLVHGVLHLLGLDHELGDEASDVMAAEEVRIMQALSWKGAGLIELAGVEDSEEDEAESLRVDGALRCDDANALPPLLRLSARARPADARGWSFRDNLFKTWQVLQAGAACVCAPRLCARHHGPCGMQSALRAAAARRAGARSRATSQTSLETSAWFVSTWTAPCWTAHRASPRRPRLRSSDACVWTT